jgi:polyisoprenoid-binding protein YceI
MIEALILKVKTRVLKYCAIVCCSLLLISVSTFAISSFAITNFESNNNNSSVAFSGEHVGMTFSGVFEKWSASVVLPPAQNPQIIATFDLRSAKTGDFTYDSTLPQGDWFDVQNYPTGKFVSDAIEQQNGRYKVTGKLTLRGVAHEQTFFLEESELHLNATFPVDRLVYGIGLDSDPDAEWVSRYITMTVRLSAD